MRPSEYHHGRLKLPFLSPRGPGLVTALSPLGQLPEQKVWETYVSAEKLPWIQIRTQPETPPRFRTPAHLLLQNRVLTVPDTNMAILSAAYPHPHLSHLRIRSLVLPLPPFLPVPLRVKS